MGPRLRETPANAGELPETQVGIPKPAAGGSPVAFERDPCPPGTIVGGKYEVTSRIGRGGMGVVVAAKHIQLGHFVAIKMMHEEDATDAMSVKRFLREGRAAAALKSDRAVRIHDVGRLESGLPYLVMEHLVGSDLSAYVKRKRQLPVDQAVEFIVQASAALAEAHASGLIHRDLKPHNLFLARLSDGGKRIKVLDFGLVKEANSGELTSTMDTPSAPEGTILGSPHFMSPEQIRDAGAVDARTDVWSLGATFFQLLTGEPPFQAGTIHHLLAKILTEKARDIRTLRSDVPDGVAAVIAKCLASDANDRFEGVEDLVRALNACGATTALPTMRDQAPFSTDTPAEFAVPDPALLAPTDPDVRLPATAPRSPNAVPPPPLEAILSPATVVMPRIDSAASPAPPLRASRIAAVVLAIALLGAIGFVAFRASARRSSGATTTATTTTTASASVTGSTSPTESSPSSTRADPVSPSKPSSTASASSSPQAPTSAPIGKAKPRGGGPKPTGTAKPGQPDPYRWQP